MYVYGMFTSIIGPSSVTPNFCSQQTQDIYSSRSAATGGKAKHSACSTGAGNSFSPGPS